MNCRGFALPLAVLALVVIEVLVAAAFLVGMYEQRLGRHLLEFEQARAVAASGVALATVGWDTVTFDGLALGDSALIAGANGSGPGMYRGAVARLNQRLFLVRVTGAGGDVIGPRAVAALVVRRDSGGATPLVERSYSIPY